MSQRVLDVFFRHKFLIVLPLVILALVGVAASLSRQTTEYASSANIWTQRTPLLASRLGGQGGAFTTPAAHQATVINDLLRLQSFRLTVGEKVDALAGLDPGSQAQAVREGTAVFPSGVSVLTIRHVDEDPARAQGIVQAIIDAYSETFNRTVISEADTAEAFYDERLDAAGVELDAAERALFDYQGTLDPIVLADPAVSDPELAALQDDVRRAERDYDELLGRLQDIHLQRDQALKGRDLSFQVMDPAYLPASPLVTPISDLVALPIVGVLLGISASVVVLFALVRMDDSIRLPAEARRLGVPVLAVVPELGRRRLRSWPQDFVRLVVAASRGLLGNVR